MYGRANRRLAAGFGRWADGGGCAFESQRGEVGYSGGWRGNRAAKAGPEPACRCGGLDPGSQSGLRRVAASPQRRLARRPFFPQAKSVSFACIPSANHRPIAGAALPIGAGLSLIWGTGRGAGPCGARKIAREGRPRADREGEGEQLTCLGGTTIRMVAQGPTWVGAVARSRLCQRGAPEPWRDPAARRSSTCT